MPGSSFPVAAVVIPILILVIIGGVAAVVIKMRLDFVVIYIVVQQLNVEEKQTIRSPTGNLLKDSGH